MRGDNCTEAYPPDHEIPQVEGYRYRYPMSRVRGCMRGDNRTVDTHPDHEIPQMEGAIPRPRTSQGIDTMISG